MVELLQKLMPWLVGLAPVPKLLFSFTLLLLTAFVLVVIWTSPPSSSQPSSMNTWPGEKTFPMLRAAIERISTTNRRILAIVLEAGRDGIYANELAQRTALTRDEVVYRTKELASLELLEILDLTDKNYRISDGVRQAVGPSDIAVLRTLFRNDDESRTESTRSAMPPKEQPSSRASPKELFAEIVGPSTIFVGKRAIYRAEFEGDLAFEWHYTQPVKLTDRNVFVELGYPGQTETLTLRVKSPGGQTFTTSKMITAVAPP